MSHKKTFKLSSRERRLGAALIDGIIPFILSFIMILLLIGVADTAEKYSYNEFGYEYGYNYNYSTTAGLGIGVLVCMLLSMAFLVVQIIFYTKSQSIGKAILGMQVVSSRNGKPVGIWWMLLRECIVKKASAVCFMLGYIWILIDKRNRAWHDKILDTYVVDTKPVEAPVVKTEEPVEELAAETEEPVEELATETEEPVAEMSVESELESAVESASCPEEVVAEEQEVSYGDHEEQNNREESAE